MGWSQNTLIDALKVLTEHGFIERIGTKNVSDYPQDAIVYRFL